MTVRKGIYMAEYSFGGLVKRKIHNLADVHDEYCVLSDNKLYYTHPTYEVSSLSEFVDIVSRVNSAIKNPLYDKTIIYRGHSSKEYLPVPGLSRLKNSDTDTENVIINDFITLRPDEFSNLTSSFDILSKMQHYRLTTRLLDFTLNPLVALYFACEDQSRIDARVLFHSTYIERDTDEYVKAICDFAIKSQLVDTNIPIENYFCSEKLTLRKYLFNTYGREMFVVRPKNWTQRLKNQSGLMMIFPNNMHDRLMYALINCRKMGVDEAIKGYVRGSIDRASFEKIFQIEPIDFYDKYYRKNNTQLFSRELYIALLSAYKNIDTKDYSYWEKYEYLFKNRFNTTESLIEIEPDLLNKEFFSVIIKGKNKKSILKELSLVGIDADFIYPELEYTAKKIKNYYSY